MTVSKKSNVLLPQYMQQFQCIGSECEDTCCAGWAVTIDKATYRKYRNCRDNELQDSFQKNLTRNRNNPTDATYAKMKLKEDLSCPFLNHQKLCSIQLRLGEDHLSHTCRTYPRAYNLIDGVIEKSATMSCPEAARLALLNPNKMEFTHIEEAIERKDIHGRIFDTNHPQLSKRIEKYFWDLRIFTIQILQSREYKLWERLIILGMFYQTIQEYLEQGKLEEIPEYIAEYTTGIEHGIFDDTLNNIPSNEMVQINLLLEVLSNKKQFGGFGQRFLNRYNEFRQGIHADEHPSISRVIENYVIAYERYYAPFIEHHEYILENYLVNYVFMYMFPLYKTNNLFENYVLMVAHYSLIKMFLIGMSGYHKEEFSTAHVVSLISSMAKNIEHSDKFLTRTVEYFKENGYATLSHMMLLIKN